MRVFTSLDEVSEAAGQELGTSEWVEIDQQRVDTFADATGDHQWIHVDVERAKDGPFGGTIAHGYLTLSRVPWLGSKVFSFDTPGDAWQVRRVTEPLHFDNPAAAPLGLAPGRQLGKNVRRPILLKRIK